MRRTGIRYRIFAPDYDTEAFWERFFASGQVNEPGPRRDYEGAKTFRQAYRKARRLGAGAVIQRFWFKRRPKGYFTRPLKEWEYNPGIASE